MLQPDYITDPDDLLKESDEIESFLQEGYNPDSGQECTERAAQLAVYMSRSSKMLADAKYHLDRLTQSEIMEILRKQLQQHLGTSTINKMIEASCKDLNYLVNRLTEINKSTKYQLELMRTFISQAKEISKIEAYTQNVQNQ